MLCPAYKLNSYEENMCDLMRQSSDRPWKATLTELEVFIGNIIGDNHKPTKRQKDISNGMREGEFCIVIQLG